jgi:hypothetical protein
VVKAGPGPVTPPAISTLPLGSRVAVASWRAIFIEGVEAAGAKLPFGVGWGVGVGEDDESPPHPAAARTMNSVRAATPLSATVFTR